MPEKMYWLGHERTEPSRPAVEQEIFASRATAEQRVAWEALAEGQNVCILGPGGTGKSQFIQWVKHLYLESGQVVVTTASTANAAFLLQGTTVHKFAGLPVACCDESKMSIVEAVDKYLKHVSSLGQIVNNILQVQLWICDEISMISPRIFCLIDIAFRYFRSAFDKPFGACQFLWSGDFLQIPPVVKQQTGRKRSQDSSSYLFGHAAWVDSWCPWVISFTTNKRSSQLAWSELLARVRMGRPTEDDLARLRSRTVSEMRFRGELDSFMDDIVTHIYPTNLDVTRENNSAR
jgi:ATP-dependent DNA helicase PIF1